MPGLEESIENICSLVRRTVSTEDFDSFCAEKCRVTRYKIVNKIKSKVNVMQLAERKSGKNYARAVQTKNDGNSEFKAGKWEVAINLYNKSLLYMPAEYQTDLATLYGNRSAALFNMKEFHLTVADIERAEPFFPKENLHRILLRKAKALMELQEFHEALITCIKTQQNIHENGKISEPQKRIILQELTVMLKFLRRNSMEPKKSESKPCTADELFMSNDVKIASNKVEGRFATSCQDIVPGSLILTEEPYAAVLTGSHRDTHCQHCLKCLTLTPLFCESCTDVAFCSTECKALATYHKFECGYGVTLSKCKQSMAFHLALRIITCQDISYYVSLKDIITKDTSVVHVERGYKAIAALLTHESEFSKNKLFDFTMVAKFLTHILKLTGYFDGAETEEEYIGSLIVHNILVLHYNAHEIFELEKFDGETTGKIQTIGGALYPTLALFNHSCAPNTVRYYDGKTVKIRSTKTIYRGEQIGENYGPIFTQDKKSDRQLVLKEKYRFDCACLACTQDWPTLKDAAAAGDETLNLKCQQASCSGTVTVKGGTRSEVPCPKCKELIFLDDVLQHLFNADALMQCGFEWLQKEKIESATENYLKAIAEMDLVIEPPYSKYSKCQKNLRTCYAEVGNKRVHKVVAASTDTNYFM